MALTSIAPTQPKIHKLGPNQPADRFYHGGERIAEFRSSGVVPQLLDGSTLRTPEDWIGSTTEVFGEPGVGLTTLADGTLLRDAVRANPTGWLGPEHGANRGNDPELLVKLLDAGEDLPVHSHPGRFFSGTHLGIAHGKTEAWIVLAPAEVAVGFSRDVSAAELRRWVDEQDAEALLAAMNRVSMGVGESIIIPAGLPHAIGRGAFVVELQEPTDHSIMIQWEGYKFDGPANGHLNLGFDIALEGVRRTALSTDEIRGLKTVDANATGPLFPKATDFFRADRLRGADLASWDASFAVAIVTAGAGALVTASGDLVPVRAGETLVVPFAAGAIALEGDAEIVVCRPPVSPPGQAQRDVPPLV